METLDTAESKGIPLFLPQLCKGWQAISAWKGADGLLRMQHRVQEDVPCSVMHSESDIFVGDLREYQPMAMSFQGFITAALLAQGGQEAPHLYLAQQELKGTGLAPLLQDTETPSCLHGRKITSTNLWMCIRGSRSNIHYDPYSNVLCVVQGQKKVSLFSPACTPFLRPNPLASDSANHSQVDFASPDYEKHPEFRLAMEQRVEYTMQAGDALFIPEGFWHQVDSTGVTIAVNFWWQSTLTAFLREQPHCRFYHLRVVMGEALGTMLEQLVANCPALDLSNHAAKTVLDHNQQQQQQQPSPCVESRHIVLTPREAIAVSVAYELLSQPPCVNPGLCQGTAPMRQEGVGIYAQNPLQLPADQLSCLYRALSAAELVHCLYEVSLNQPLLIQTMFYVHMSPLAAYMLTSKLEVAEKEGVFLEELRDVSVPEGGAEQPRRQQLSGSKDLGCQPSKLGQADFYCSLYGACTNPEQVFHRLLDLRQELAAQAAALLLRHVVNMSSDKRTSTSAI